ncbi:hypothetical protein AGOR_G00126550 [Albula goreensis]|uniref:Linker for activation of T-cells family member 2 n=1 Tax=Albula goreensis TaxID=1534307 RepID=A0A8T3DBR5_9TELE|nr:hypothetical protein AGOR_G00126550 [Albula goreensis]
MERKGMAADFTQSGSGLTLVSLASLGVVFAVCVCCRKKSSIMRTENQIYDPQLFHGQGERIGVQSQSASRLDQISGAPLSVPEMTPPVLLTADATTTGDQPYYQNITDLTGEPTYVDPIPAATYQNLPLIDPHPAEDAETYVYENVICITEEQVNQPSDTADYENTEFLQKHRELKMNNEDKEEEDEPDYVNAPQEMAE